MKAARVYNRIETVPIEWDFAGYRIGMMTMGFVGLLAVGLVVISGSLPIWVSILYGIVSIVAVLYFITITDRYVNPDNFYTGISAWRRYLGRCRKTTVRNF